MFFTASDILCEDEEGMERECLSVFEPDVDSALYMQQQKNEDIDTITGTNRHYDGYTRNMCVWAVM